MLTFLDGVGSGTRKRSPGTVLGIPALAFGVVDNTKRVLDITWSLDRRPDASSRVCVGSLGRPWSVPWGVPGGWSVASPERHLERLLRRPWECSLECPLERHLERLLRRHLERHLERPWSVSWTVT